MQPPKGHEDQQSRCPLLVITLRIFSSRFCHHGASISDEENQPQRQQQLTSYDFGVLNTYTLVPGMQVDYDQEKSSPKKS